jgi:acetolactate synthase-1/3 small subunit
MPETMLAVRYNRRVGAVDRIFSLLRRREFPISGMTLERTHEPEIDRMTITVSDPSAVTQISRHLNRLADVLDVEPRSSDAVTREYALVRIRCTPKQRTEVMPVLAAFGAQALKLTADRLVLEAAGTGRQLDSLVSALDPYGIEELARTSALGVATA